MHSSEIKIDTVIKPAFKRQFVWEIIARNSTTWCRYLFKNHAADIKANVLVQLGMTTLKNIRAVGKNEEDIPAYASSDFNKGYPGIFFMLFFVRHSAILSQNCSECNKNLKKKMKII